MESIPQELLIEIMLNLEITDILNLCQLNKNISKLCNNNEFWRLKSQRDYLNYTQTKSRNITWKEFYLHRANPRKIPIIYAQNAFTRIPIGGIWIKLQDTPEQIVSTIMNLVNLAALEINLSEEINNFNLTFYNRNRSMNLFINVKYGKINTLSPKNYSPLSDTELITMS